jgi:hypothetical protein
VAVERRQQQTREIASDISSTLADAIDTGIEKGAGAGLQSLAKSALDTIRQIERELLNSLLVGILTGKQTGSNAGGVVGAVSNKILSAILGKPKVSTTTANNPTDANTQTVSVNTGATDRNTSAIEENTRALLSAKNSTDTASNASNSVAHVASDIVSALSAGSGGGGFWSGLLQAVIGGAVSGAVGSIGAGGGGGGGGKSAATESFAYEPDANFGNIPFLGAFGGRHAGGGYISGPGDATSDSIPTLLSNGEEVINAAAVNRVGRDYLDGLNRGEDSKRGQTVNFHPNSINLHVVMPAGVNPNTFPGRNRRMIAEAAAEGITDALEHKYGR